MYHQEMEMSGLYQLGRRLSEIALEHMGAGNLDLTPGEFMVLHDLFMNGESSISDSVRRTGLAQSRVSTSVAGFVERGWAVRAADPRDGRKTLVRLTDSLRAEGNRRRARRADDAPGGILSEVPPAERAGLLQALDRLHHLLVEGSPPPRPADTRAVARR
jgi:DNA-binding MarR family transcriptional regulator